MPEEKQTHLDPMERIRARREKAAELRPKKKRKLPAILIFFNIFLIGIMMFHYTRSAPETRYYTGVVKITGVRYKLTIAHEQGEKKFRYTLAVKNETAAEKRISYRDPVARLTVLHGDTGVLSLALGEKTRDLVLKPGESRMFLASSGEGAYYDFANAHKEYITGRGKSFLSAEKRFIPLTAELALQTQEGVSSYLEFKYEVN